MNIKRTDIATLILRFSFSFSLIIIHGLDKLSMVMEGEDNFPDPLGIGSLTTLLLLIMAEVISPLFVIMGFKVRYFVIPVLLTLLVALLIFHAGDTFEDRELAYVYLFAFGVIGVLGGGRYSLDHYLRVRSNLNGAS